MYAYLVLALVLIASSASARPELLRWTHDPDPVPAVRFDAVVDGGAHVSVGNPTPDAQGIREATIEVEPSPARIHLVAVAEDGTESDPSNEITRPTPGFASFRLWDAATDTPLGEFESGAVIDPVSLPCAAIEIVPVESVGSIAKALDGEHTCTQPGLDHENSAPYAWEEDAGPGRFGCPRKTLVVPGEHVLRVRGFASTSCTGSILGEASVSFTVAGEVVPEPEPTPEPDPFPTPEQCEQADFDGNGLVTSGDFDGEGGWLRIYLAGCPEQ
ncbi:MAG TPA: hypothetical protein VGB13_07935 [Candidatus Krumholzibacteria bacterium]